MVVEVTEHFCVIAMNAFFYKLLEQSRHLWSGKHPSSKGRRILCQPNSTIHTFHSLVLLVSLIKGDCRERLPSRNYAQIQI